MLKKETYSEIIEFIKNHNGLTFDCEEDLRKMFPDIHPHTLGSIIGKYGQNRIRSNHYKLTQKAAQLLQQYEKLVVEYKEKSILKIAHNLKYPPFSLCRIILAEKYKGYLKSDLKEMLKDVNLIPDSMFAANVSVCMFNDKQDGMLIDMIRYTVGEEYEVKMKECAKKLGLAFYDEHDLRREGYDKTPDMKLAIPCMYKDRIINWFESKASFGDIESHNKYLNDQYSSYSNRFGPGMVIYWFGYHEDILNNQENRDLTICDRFPTEDELTLLKFESNP